jgi:hypothetical protein
VCIPNGVKELVGYTQFMELKDWRPLQEASHDGSLDFEQTKLLQLSEYLPWVRLIPNKHVPGLHHGFRSTAVRDSRSKAG